MLEMIWVYLQIAVQIEIGIWLYEWGWAGQILVVVHIEDQV